MYPFGMKREILKEILLKHYVNSAANSILRGIRKPSYEVMVELDKKHNIPFNSWIDIKSYLQENDTKTTPQKSTTTPNAKVSA
jgi:hypothetical protein